MKHAGSREDLLSQSVPEAAEPEARGGPLHAAGSQSRLSLTVSLACALFLVAVVADPVVRDHARSLDPTVVSALRLVTEFGNSAWPLGIGLALLGCIALARRREPGGAAEALMRLRSSLLFMIAAVALSGAIANVTKYVIGRARPSAFLEAGVLDFSVLALMPSWASFPSGHATTATACALALAIACPRQAWACMSVGLIASLSRAFLGVHWLSDAIAGMVLGAVVTLALRKAMVARGHRFGIEGGTAVRCIGCALAELGRLVQQSLAGALSAVRPLLVRVTAARNGRPPDSHGPGSAT